MLNIINWYKVQSVSIELFIFSDFYMFTEIYLLSI